MIRPLRRRHRWMISTLFVVVVFATVLALARPAPSPCVDSLPPALVGAEGSKTPR
jgi:hypothetical protein